MFSAFDNEKCRIDVDDAENGGEYYCPVCGGQLIVKDGEINAKHFAHKAGSCTDAWHYDMSAWHRRMQGLFPSEQREVVVTDGTQLHRADILVGNTVIEFQHSPISVTEFIDRTTYFQKTGYRIAWVFDLSEQFENGQLFYDDDDDPWMKWKNPYRIFSAGAPITDNSKDYAIWIYLVSEDDENDDTINKVIWTQTDINGCPSLRRFRHSEYPISLATGQTISPDDFFRSRTDYFYDELRTLREKFHFTVKYFGEKGKPRDAYVCPLSPERFGISIFGGTGCAYCRYCYMIVRKKRKDKLKWAVYCCYPAQAREPEGNPSDYECPMVQMLEI